MKKKIARKTDPIAAARGILKGTALSSQRYFELKQQDKKLEDRPKRQLVGDIEERGFQALVEALGVAGAARFVAQTTGGLGDYTEERRATLADLTLEEIVQEIKVMRRKGKLPAPGSHGAASKPAEKEAAVHAKKKPMSKWH